MSYEVINDLGAYEPRTIANLDQDIRVSLFNPLHNISYLIHWNTINGCNYPIDDDSNSWFLARINADDCSLIFRPIIQKPESFIDRCLSVRRYHDLRKLYACNLTGGSDDDADMWWYNLFWRKRY